jgi:hypothetical protein
MFYATNECDSDSKKWCFLLKWMVTPKNQWQKQKCDWNGYDYKLGLLYLPHFFLILSDLIDHVCAKLSFKKLFNLRGKGAMS